MINPPSVDIRQLLIDDGALTSDQIFVGKSPQQLTTAHTTLIDNGGSTNPRWLRDETNLQALVRGATQDYLSGWEMAQTVKDTILGREQFVVNDVLYIRFLLLNDILFIGYDENERPTFSLNFQVVRDYSAVGDSNRDVIQ